MTMASYISTSDDSEQVTLTIYNDNFGAVKERRRMPAMPRCSLISYMDVAARIETDSILVKGVDIIEMNYEYDLVNKSKLLEKYLDHTVYVRTASGSREAYRLLSVNHGILLEHTASKEIVLDPAGELILPSLPEGLIVRPALNWRIRPMDGERPIDVSYLTKGFAWTVNYVVSLQEDKLSLTGWVDIKNETGTTFPSARIKLIAGEVKRIEAPEPPSYHPEILYSRCAESSISGFEEKEFADYHLYTLQGETTLKSEQSKQVRLFQAEDVPCRIYYECTTSAKRADIMVKFDNDEASQLGIPLPKGRIKVYQEDQSDGEHEFIGEDEIEHTPKNESVSLHIGEAFDIVLEHARTELKRVGRGHTAESHQVVFRNHKSASARIKLSHTIYERFWHLSDTSHPYEKEGERGVVYWIDVPAGGETMVKFTVDLDEKLTLYVE
jgi:hypothetical protein